MQDKIQEIMAMVKQMSDADFSAGECAGRMDYAGSAKYEGEASILERAIESKLRELVREQEEAKKYADMLAMCMFEKHYAQDEPYSSGAVKFELFDSLHGVISQIDNMASGLERAHNINNASGVE